MAGDYSENTTVADEEMRLVHRIMERDRSILKELADRPTYDDGDTPMNNEGCKRLAMAVLQQAIDDLRLPIGTHEYPSALAFLTSGHNDWVRQRDFWASCAGMEPDALSEHALKMVGA